MCECRKSGGTEIKNGIKYWVYLCMHVGGVIWERYPGFKDDGTLRDPSEPTKLPEKPIRNFCY